MSTSNASPALGFVNKPLVEKFKIFALVVLIAASIFFSRPTPVLLILGAVLTLLGAAVRVWAAGHLTRDRRLAVSGPYAHTRNPFYLGRFLFLIGIALMSGLSVGGNAFGPVLWAIFVAGVLFFFFGYMPRKEKREGGRLEQLFGAQFRDYRKNVPSLFPRLTPYRCPHVSEKRPWSRELFFGGTSNFSGNKELPTTLFFLALVVAFVVRYLTLPR